MSLKVIKCWFCGSLHETETETSVPCHCGHEAGPRPKIQLKRHARRQPEIKHEPEFQAATSPDTHHLAVAESFKTLNVEACDFYRTRPRGNSALTRDTLCWIALFAIGVPLAYLRYGTVLDKGTLGSLSNFGKTYGVAIMLIFHVLCVLAAFKDEISRGMLALVVPCYSFFYVFSMSDQYVVRVLLGLFLIAFGFETYEGFLGFVRSADVHIQSMLGKA